MDGQVDINQYIKFCLSINTPRPTVQRQELATLHRELLARRRRDARIFGDNFERLHVLAMRGHLWQPEDDDDDGHERFVSLVSARIPNLVAHAICMIPVGNWIWNLLSQLDLGDQRRLCILASVVGLTVAIPVLIPVRRRSVLEVERFRAGRITYYILRYLYVSGDFNAVISVLSVGSAFQMQCLLANASRLGVWTLSEAHINIYTLLFFYVAFFVKFKHFKLLRRYSGSFFFLIINHFFIFVFVDDDFEDDEDDDEVDDDNDDDDDDDNDIDDEVDVDDDDDDDD